MPTIRKTDKHERTHFRSDRFSEENGYWFFYTREGTIEGPSASLTDAKIRLDNYIKVMESGLLEDSVDFFVEY